MTELGLLENPQHSLKYLEEVEMLGEEIVRDKQEVVALDRRRNQNREALRALYQSGGKTWLTLGSLLVKVPGDKARELLEQGRSQLSLFPKDRNILTDRIHTKQHAACLTELILFYCTNCGKMTVNEWVSLRKLRLEALIMVSTKVMVFWDMKPYSSVDMC